MELLLDTANIEKITQFLEYLPISGVTTNPSILKAEKGAAFFELLSNIRTLVGDDRSLHVQTVSTDAEGMVAEGLRLWEFDPAIYVKIPVTKEGLHAIRILKEKKVRITATAIYTRIQAYLAILAGADYIAPYYNRMENLNTDAKGMLEDIVCVIKSNGSKTKILGASYKNVGQINRSIEAGCHALTVSPDLLETFTNLEEVEKAVDVFRSDWESVYGEGTTILDM